MSSQAHSPALALETATIQNRLAGDACLSYRIGESQQKMRSYTLAAEARFSECRMTLETSSTSEGMGTTSSFRVSLNQLDPLRIQVRDGLRVPPNAITVGDLPLFAVRLMTEKDRKQIEVALETIEGGVTKHEMHNASELDIRVKSKEAATRLADAFRRAVTLCAKSGE
jgi:hypothetical protein